MKSLMKIIRRYIFSTAILIITILTFNVAVLSFIGYRSGRNLNSSHLFAGEQMNNVAEEFSVSNTLSNGEIAENSGQYQLSQRGTAYLEEYRVLWSMLLDEGGNVVWSWRLPQEIPHSYGITDVAKFSRWYLCDYPVRVWETDGKLLVFGYDKTQFVKIHLVYPLKTLQAFPEYLSLFLGMNLMLFLLLALCFAYRFYLSLRPVCAGIDALAERSPVMLKEWGMASELAKRLNQTSRILEKQDQKLRQRDDARTSWISGVSHDIRTPLALIMGYSEALAENPCLEAEAHEQAEAIRCQSLFIRQLIEDLNLTSRLEYHAQPLRMEEYCPAVLLRETVAEYYNEGLAETCDITVHITSPAERVRQQGDVLLLKRALRNVIGNSIRHNPKGCRITLQLFVEMEYVIWRIQDSGPGIPQKVINILEGRTDSSKEEIHIMGLRIVKQIIAAHNGHTSFPKKETGGYDVEFAVPIK